MSKPTTFQDAVELVTLAEKDNYVPDTSKKRRINQASPGKFNRIQVLGGESGAITACATCGRNHSGECRYGKGVCFTCEKPGHMSKECKARPICYSCGDPEHRQRECPKKNTEPQRLLGGSSEKKPEAPKVKGRVFQMTVKEAKGTPDVVTGTFLVNKIPARVLFDSGANKSFVSTKFCIRLGRSPILLSQNLEVETANGDITMVRECFDNCIIEIEGQDFEVHLLPMGIREFDVVIGMDWFSKHQAHIIFFKKLIRVRNKDGNEITVYGSRPGNHVNLISVIKARRCIRKGCETYLAYVINAKMEKGSIEEVPVVWEFPYVFPDDLPGVPPERQVEFRIELTPGATPIAKSPYRLAPSEMQELMNQIQELLDKGFIRPSSSP
ncbi:uncharacterized protein LOC112504752 [Cynara cardunculus var. scolymus]|uniref:uncharacterized protein LOC112504752 n=1 Tax=Cynara cardunculus var. scolymus TaxID=59895 RepID=UPI000D63126B|nr:uncharacterized protein LOC112504752 [Cynara cardunculus var. scolymus]